jgi:hypothetical protein
VIAACFVLARPFARAGWRRAAAGVRVAGAIFAIGLAESLAGGPVGSLVLFAGASVALVAIALAAARLRSGPALRAT